MSDDNIFIYDIYVCGNIEADQLWLNMIFWYLIILENKLNLCRILFLFSSSIIYVYGLAFLVF